MSPEELKYYIEQYQKRNREEAKILSGWSNKFLVETIQKGLLENGYDISFTDKNGNLIEGENAIDGVSGHSFKSAISQFATDYKNRDKVTFDIDIVPTSHVLMETMVMYGGAEKMNQEEVQSYMEAMAQVNAQNSHTIRFSVVTGKNISEVQRIDLIDDIKDKLLDEGFDGRGLYMGFYNGVENISDLNSFESSNIITSLSDDGFEKINYQFDAPENYNENQIETDKAKIKAILKEAIKDIRVDKTDLKSVSKPIADLDEIIRAEEINLEWSEEVLVKANGESLELSNKSEKGRIV